MLDALRGAVTEKFPHPAPLGRVGFGSIGAGHKRGKGGDGSAGPYRRLPTDGLALGHRAMRDNGRMRIGAGARHQWGGHPSAVL